MGTNMENKLKINRNHTRCRKSRSWSLWSIEERLCCTTFDDPARFMIMIARDNTYIKNILLRSGLCYAIYVKKKNFKCTLKPTNNWPSMFTSNLTCQYPDNYMNWIFQSTNSIIWYIEIIIIWFLISKELLYSN